MTDIRIAVHKRFGRGCMETREQMEQRLAELKARLLTVEGTPTEVYSRIVGYYRSVRNWNAGKREEFGNRMEYAFPAGLPSQAVTARGILPKQGIASYLLFARDKCPNCPPVKAYLAATGLLGAVVDVDTAEGLDQARRYEVLSTPTAVLLDADGEEIARAKDRAGLDGLLGLGKPAEVSAAVGATA